MVKSSFFNHEAASRQEVEMLSKVTPQTAKCIKFVSEKVKRSWSVRKKIYLYYLFKLLCDPEKGSKSAKLL